MPKEQARNQVATSTTTVETAKPTSLSRSRGSILHLVAKCQPRRMQLMVEFWMLQGTADSACQNERLSMNVPILLLAERDLVARHLCPFVANSKCPAELVATAKKGVQLKQLGSSAVGMLQ
jgi:hypothetical protein